MDRRSAEGVLGLSWPYSPKDVKRAYRSAAKACHPDLAGAGGHCRSHEKMVELNEAVSLILEQWDGRDPLGDRAAPRGELSSPPRAPAVGAAARPPFGRMARRAALRIARFFPYRAALLVTAWRISCAALGVDVAATMGLCPPGWDASAIAPALFAASMALLAASSVNLAVPFITAPVRKVLISALS